MKKTILIIVCIFVSRQVSAQRDTVLSNHHEITSSLGYYSFTFLDNDQSLLNSNAQVAINVAYTYRFTKVIGLSMVYTYAPRFKDIEYHSSFNTDEIIGKLSLSTHSIVPMLKINFLNTKYVVLYAKVGFGITYLENKINNYYPERYDIVSENDHFFFAFQIVPIGIEIGTKKYAGFFENGLGCQGYYTVGFRLGL